MQSGALAAQFVQVVWLAEGNVVKCEKSAGTREDAYCKPEKQ